MTAQDRLIANCNSIISSLVAFSSPVAQDVSYTWINDDNTTTDIIYSNIAKYQSELQEQLDELGDSVAENSQYYGKVLQVVSKSVGEIITVNSRSFVNISNSLDATITPKKSNSKILVSYTFGHSVSTQHHTTSFRLLQNGTLAGTPTSGGGSRTQGSVSVRGQYNIDNANSVTITAEIQVNSLDDITFSLEGRCRGPFMIGASQRDRSDSWGWKVPTQITIMEIGE